MFKIILAMILCGTGATKVAEMKIDLKQFSDNVLYHFYVFSGSNYSRVTKTGSLTSFAGFRQDWRFVVENDELYLKYVGYFSLENRIPGMLSELRSVKEYKITPAGLAALSDKLRLKSYKENDIEIDASTEYVVDSVSRKSVIEIDAKRPGATGEVEDLNYEGEVIFELEAKAGDQEVRVKMKKSFLNHNVILGYTNWLPDQRHEEGNCYFDCLYVLSIKPKID